MSLWKPKYGEYYYFVGVCDFGDLLIQTRDRHIGRKIILEQSIDICHLRWGERNQDYANLLNKNVFKTEKEAEHHRDKIIGWMLENDAIWKLESKEGFQFKKFS